MDIFASADAKVPIYLRKYAYDPKTGRVASEITPKGTISYEFNASG